MLQYIVVLCVLEIKLLAANDISCWELISKGATLLLNKLRFKAHKKFDALIGLVEFFLTAM